MSYFIDVQCTSDHAHWSRGFVTPQTLARRIAGTAVFAAQGAGKWHTNGVVSITWTAGFCTCLAFALLQFRFPRIWVQARLTLPPTPRTRQGWHKRTYPGRLDPPVHIPCRSCERERTRRHGARTALHQPFPPPTRCRLSGQVRGPLSTAAHYAPIPPHLPRRSSLARLLRPPVARGREARGEPRGPAGALGGPRRRGAGGRARHRGGAAPARLR